MDIWQLVGFTASVTGAISLAPEVITAFKSRHLNDVAWGMLLLLLSASILWATYGILTTNYPLILSAGVNILMELILLFLKRKYEAEAQQKELPSTVFAEQTPSL